MDLIDQYRQQRDKLLQRREKLLKGKKSPLIVTKARTLDSHNHAISLLSQHSRLPSLDIEKRLHYASLTSPNMRILKYEKKIVEDVTDLFIHLKFTHCGDFQIRLKIINNSIDSLHITPSVLTIDECNLVNSLIMVSQLSCDVSLFIYRMNSLLKLRNTRKTIWNSIIEHTKPSKVSSINGIPIKDIKANPNILISNSPSSLAFKLRNKSISISWNLIFKNKRQCSSDFMVLINNKKNITKLFKSLIKARDVKFATLQILNTI